MLSYQHIYHAGNLADVHKHGLLAWILAYLTRKNKPLTYIETHAGRALYDLSDPSALKTGEAAQGIDKVLGWFPPEHPYTSVLDQTRAAQGIASYPGSPQIAAQLLRSDDPIHLAELHPQEHAALTYAMSSCAAKCYQMDGFELAHSLCPPSPRRGILVVDPSYEIKSDYINIPKHFARLTKAWNVGVICLWYPILKSMSHREMVQNLQARYPSAGRYEVHFPPARPGHGMVGSGFFVVNPPFGLDLEARRLAALFETLDS